MNTKTEIYVSPIMVERERVLARYLQGDVTRTDYIAEDIRLSEEQFAETLGKAKFFLDGCAEEQKERVRQGNSYTPTSKRYY